MPSSWERVERVGGKLVLLPWRDVEFKIAIGLSWGVGYNSPCYILLLLGILIRESLEKAAADALALEMAIEPLNAWPAS